MGLFDESRRSAAVLMVMIQSAMVSPCKEACTWREIDRSLETTELSGENGGVGSVTIRRQITE